MEREITHYQCEDPMEKVILGALNWIVPPSILS